MQKIDKNKNKISAMFNNIAPKYDFLNHLLSLGIDKNWRKKIRKNLNKYQYNNILDIATGTGDLAIELAKLKVNYIIGMDIAEKMIEKAKKKVLKKGLDNKIVLTKGDSLNIDFNNNTFDAITCSFGVRNFQNLNKGLAEMFRVLKKNGQLVILEFSEPDIKFINFFYKFYFLKILPTIGRIISKSDNAYNYLPYSVEEFPKKNKFVEILLKQGFVKVSFKNLTCGIATIYIAKK